MRWDTKHCRIFYPNYSNAKFSNTWRVTEGHREREGRGVKFLENEAEGYEDFLVDKA